MTRADRLAALGTACLFEAAVGSQAMLSAIKPITSGMILAGRARPVRTVPGDNLALHDAVTRLAEGEVLVVDAGADTETAIWGDVLAAAAMARGGAGLVVDGAVRDVATMTRQGFAVFARATAVPGPAKRHAGTLDEPIVCAGAAVRTGDWIVGDDDGVIVLDADTIGAALEAAAVRRTREDALVQRLIAGETTTIEALDLTATLSAARQHHA